MISAILTVLLRFVKEFSRNPRVSRKKSGNSRDFRTFSFEFPGFSEISQITIFGLKPYPRGSGAWKQPQRSISKAGLHRIPWFLWAGSLPDVEIPWPSPASQVVRPPPPSPPTHPHPPENFEYSEYSGYSGCSGTSEYLESPDHSEISEHSECSECSEHAENC